MAVSLPGSFVPFITGSFLLVSSSSREQMTFRSVRNAATWRCL